MRVRKGITLAELMLVIAVIALLAAVIYPASAWYMSRARDSDRKNDVQNAAIHLSNFFTDYRSYPEPDETGCLAPDVFRGTIYKNILLESAPKGNTVDSSNPCVGKYAYGTSTGDTAYILVAYLENQYAGNYSGSTNGMLGRGRVTRE